jgi:malonate-semialdehyde dehydrogenase (acetylating)/methylmalonate-semialdehyde dehydrogenase
VPAGDDVYASLQPRTRAAITVNERSASISITAVSGVQARVLDNFVGGRWVPATTGELFDVTNPATGELLARAPLSGREDVEAAVAAARAALPGWRAVSVIKRAQLLFALREAMTVRAEELAASVTREMGKTIGDARAEVERAIEMVEAATAVPQTMQGRNLEGVATNVDCETIRQPVGVCAAITPFNFPAMVPFWFLPFAIATGNTFILKPSEQDPITQTIVFEILEALELPPGVANLVNGAHDVVNAILDSPGIDAVSFVGSAKVARHVYERAAAHGKRVQALGGAKNHMVVMPDAVIGKTAENIIASAFGAAGQRCMAGSVLVAVGGAWKALRPELVARTTALTVGDPSVERVDVGPLISPAACSRIEGEIQAALDAGASLALDGRSPDGARDGGGYLGPTILENVAPDSDAVREEIFGPVLCVLEADTLGEAIGLVNASRYGNGSSIFTESGAAARRYRSEVQAGMIGVNIGVAAPVAFFPFSGWKGSFFGDIHAHGQDAVDFYTRKKTITSRWFSEPAGRFFVE